MPAQAPPSKRPAGGLAAFGDALLSRLVIPDEVEEGDPASLARSSLGEFGKYMMPGYTIPKHIGVLIEKLEAVERGEISKLMIMTPPQSGKSTCASQLFPAWCLGRKPSMRVINTSYGAHLAERNSRNARALLYDVRWPFTGVELDPNTRGVGHWQTRQGGYYHAVGVGGPSTGFSSDLFIVDDPFSGPVDADSVLIRDSVWDWFQGVVRTRLPKAILVINTRWHEDDLTGRILSSAGGGEWEQVIFREWAEEDDTLGREVGEVLWPEMYPPEKLPSLELGEIDQRRYDCEWQQRPTAAKGNMFQREWWKRYDPETMRLRGLKPMFTTVDSAFKTGVKNDWSVAATWGWFEDRAYLMDVWRGRVDFPDLCQVLRDVYAKHRVPIYIEDAASGQSLVQALSRPLGPTAERVRAQPPVPVIAEKVSRRTNNVGRVEPYARYVAAGMVLVPEAAAWVGDFIEEHASFPSGKFDDQVETTAIALKKLFAGLERAQPTEVRYNRLEVDADRPKGRWITEMRDQRRAKAQAVIDRVYKEQEERRELARLDGMKALEVRKRLVGVNGNT